MTSTPLVSIILPTYNGEKFLEQSIMSCINQTYQNWELILVDDCSKDHTSEIIDKFTVLDRRIRALRNLTNRKLPGSLNHGFLQAQGKYLTWTSDDNAYRSDALMEMVDYLEVHSDVGMVYCDYTVMDQSGQESIRIKVGEPKDLGFNNCVGACFLYRREVYESVGDYSEELFLAEDYDYWLRISQLYTIQALHKDLYLYRRHEDSLSNKNINRVNMVAEQVLKQNLPKMSWLDSADKAKGYIRLLGIAESNKNLKGAFGYLLNAFLTSPGYVISEEHSRINGFMCNNVPVYNFIFRKLKKVMPGAIKWLKHKAKS